MEKVMKKMTKKLGSILIACIAIIGLAACGDKLVKDAAACTIEQNGVKVRMAFDAEGDKIVKIKQTSTVSLTGYTEEQVAALQEQIDSMASEYEQIDGVSYHTEQGDSEISEQIEMNVGEEKTLKAVVKAGLLPVDEDEVTYLSLEATVDALEQAGWTIEK